MYYDFLVLFLKFLILSFLGYCCEVIYCSICEKKFINRGFLFGPVCPIYGVGGILIILLLSKYYNDLLVIFCIGMFLTSFVEYLTSYLFEVIFHNRWWDYSYRKDNINGRICLFNSFLFGLGSCFIIRIIMPFFNYLFNNISYNIVIYGGSILFILFIIDLVCSIFIAYNLRHRIIIAEELKNEKIFAIPLFVEKKYKNEISKLKIVKNRLLKAFPYISHNLKKELDLVSKIREKIGKRK